MTTPLILCRGNLPPSARSAAGPALATRFGGWTRTSGEGAWVAPDGTLIVESMDVWEVATRESAAFGELIVSLGRAVGEHSVYFTLGGEPSIVETAP